MAASVVHGVSPLTDQDIYLFKEGRHYRLHEKLGPRIMEVDGRRGAHFSVWAPNAEQVAVMGDFNGWDKASHLLSPRLDASGLWEGFISGLGGGERFKYHLRSRFNGYEVDKGDPFAPMWELPPNTASVVWDLDYRWNDGDWMRGRHAAGALDRPMSIYEMHLGSWKRPEGGEGFLTYGELAETLPDYLDDMGFTHVEFLPVMEHPFYGSWGYQCLGYFAPTSRYGSPQDFMFLVDSLHARGIGVILDWVPSHFPSDEHGLAFFDGTHLYEHADPKKGFHPDWKSDIFNFGRNEVRSFLISSAFFWLDKFHADGLRVDAVASMLYLDYSRREGEWIPNEYGGRENLEAIEFIRSMNDAVARKFDGARTIAEESTAWPQVSRPQYLGGLGFDMKWNMGWMHDTLAYFSSDPVYRKFQQGQLTFSIWYAFNENFVLALSHDEVVHGKGSLLGKMPGDAWRQFANLRLLYGYMYGHPGKKLLFMGQEFGQGPEWNHDQALRWDQLALPPHEGVRRWVRDLNAVYREEPCLSELDFSPEGFSWLDYKDAESSVVSFVRRDRGGNALMVVMNATPVPRRDYRLGVPKPGYWRELLNSDSEWYGGSGLGNAGGVASEAMPSHGYEDSVSLVLPPLGAVYLKQVE